MNGLLRPIRKLSGSASMRAAVGFGIGGIAFGLANLLLARFLSPLDFALFALVMALKEFGLGLGPAGVELLINRRHLAPTGRLAARVTFTGMLSAFLIAWIALNIYDFPWLLAGLLFVMVVASTLNHSSAAFFQSAQLFFVSLAIIQVHNFLLLALIPVELVLKSMNVEIVVAVVTAGYVIVGILGWLTANQRIREGRSVVSESILLKEGLSGLGIGLVVLIMWQIERLLIPLVLSIQDLATFGVLAAVVGAPFRMMQLGIGFTLLPRLRSTTAAKDARQLILSELRVGGLICFAGTFAILLIGPWLIRFVAGDKYDVGLDLFFAAIVVGYLRIWQGLAVASVTAVSNAGILRLLNITGWIALVVAGLGAFGLRSFGLEGIIYGVGLGWLLQAGVATILASKAFSERWATSPKLI